MPFTPRWTDKAQQHGSRARVKSSLSLHAHKEPYFSSPSAYIYNLLSLFFFPPRKASPFIIFPGLGYTCMISWRLYLKTHMIHCLLPCSPLTGMKDHLSASGSSVMPKRNNSPERKRDKRQLVWRDGNLNAVENVVIIHHPEARLKNSGSMWRNSGFMWWISRARGWEGSLEVAVVRRVMEDFTFNIIFLASHTTGNNFFSLVS